jgi:hypothetical protein
MTPPEAEMLAALDPLLLLSTTVKLLSVAVPPIMFSVTIRLPAAAAYPMLAKEKIAMLPIMIRLNGLCDLLIMFILNNHLLRYARTLINPHTQQYTHASGNANDADGATRLGTLK